MDADLPAKLRNLHEWVAPSHGLKIETIDAHAAGQPLRLILNGLPPLRGRNQIERSEYANKHFDHIRRALLFEPRGHTDMYGCILTEPQRSDSHFGALFVHRGGFSPMCGHGIIALTTILLEAGIVEARAPETRLKIDTPAGLVRCYGFLEDDRVKKVFFENVPSFALAAGEQISVPSLNLTVTYDVAYGGAFFAFVDVAQLGVTCTPEHLSVLTVAGVAIRKAIEGRHKFRHPLHDSLGYLFGVVFMDKPLRRRTGQADARHVCVFSDGCVDRSPTGMSISARLALMRAAGTIEPGTSLSVEGIMGGTFSARIVAEELKGTHQQVIVEVEGRAFITGRHTFFLDPEDPCLEGFLL